jgi:LytS/YehU family sensor histidine kinase
LAGFSPVWVVWLALVVWLAFRGEMGSGFVVPWFVLLSLASIVHQGLRSRGKTDTEVIVRLMGGLLLGPIIGALLLAVTAGLTYRCSGGGIGGLATLSCDPNRAAMVWLAVGVGVLVTARGVLALQARRRKEG